MLHHLGSATIQVASIKCWYSGPSGILGSNGKQNTT